MQCPPVIVFRQISANLFIQRGAKCAAQPTAVFFKADRKQTADCSREIEVAP
jgi:hypothetical protein